MRFDSLRAHRNFKVRVQVRASPACLYYAVGHGRAAAEARRFQTGQSGLLGANHGGEHHRSIRPSVGPAVSSPDLHDDVAGGQFHAGPIV